VACKVTRGCKWIKYEWNEEDSRGVEVSDNIFVAKFVMGSIMMCSMNMAPCFFRVKRGMMRNCIICRYGCTMAIHNHRTWGGVRREGDTKMIPIFAG
jgi:hypothetical protein